MAAMKRSPLVDNIVSQLLLSLDFALVSNLMRDSECVLKPAVENTALFCICAARLALQSKTGVCTRSMDSAHVFGANEVAHAFNNLALKQDVKSQTI